MRILLDGYNMGLQRGTGVATYGRHLSRAVKQSGLNVDVLFGGKSTRRSHALMSEVAFFDAAKADASNRMLRACHRAGAALAAGSGCEVQQVPISGTVVRDALRARMPEFDTLWNSEELFQRAIRSHRWLNRFAMVARPAVDIAHWTYPLPIYHAAAKNLYTLHDLVPLRLPHTTLDNKNRYFDMCSRIARHADHIVTVSENSRQDIINLLGADPERVTNTMQAVDFPAALLDKPEAEFVTELRGTFGLEFKGYFLFFGALEPKKNIGRIIEAYLGSGVESPLVIVGAPGWGMEDELRLLATIQKLPHPGRQRRIIQLEYLPLSMLVSVIRGAKATVFPSLYEGFGLPVVESMLLGTAVITSTTSCLPEIAGDAAMLVDPYDTAEIARAIRELESNEPLRKRLEELGRRRAPIFSPDRYAERVAGLYRDVAAEAGRPRSTQGFR